jgi:hypothetical protein
MAMSVGTPEAVFHVSSAWSERLGIRATPSVLLVDEQGRIRGRWIGWTPKPWQALEALSSLAN